MSRSQCARGLGRAAAVSLSLLWLLAASPATAQLASAILREGETVGTFGEITSINNPAVNQTGGFSVQANSSDGVTAYSHIWGHAMGGTGALIVTEGTFGGYQQTAFESFQGFSDAGVPGYSATATEVSSGITGLDGAWAGTTAILVQRQAVPTLPGQFSTFNSRVGITADGHPHWVGGISTVQGGTTQNRVLFFGAGLVPRLKSGDSVGGLGLQVTAGGIDFDYRFSPLGTHYIIEALVTSGSTANDGVIVVDGSAATAGGGVIREGSPVPPAAGGLGGENWSSFDFLGIMESGDRLVTGDTSAAITVDEFVLRGEQIVLREGTGLAGPGGSYTLNGAIEGGAMNEQGDWAVTWDVDDPMAVNREALVVNGDLILIEGDLVDLNGDGTVEPNSRLADYTGISSLVIGPRSAQGVATVYFTADIDTAGTPSSTDDKEGLFRLDVLVAPPNQAPIAICRDLTVAAGPSCQAAADVDDGSYDPDGDPITLDPTPPGPYPLGATNVMLTVSDDRGGSDSCAATVTVVPEPLVLTVDDDLLSWGPAVCDVGYDVVRGEVPSPPGVQMFEEVACIANDHATTSLSAPGSPTLLQRCWWFLVRRVGGAGNGSYDAAGTGQQGSRDAAIAASGSDCP